jgi:putative exporter of polyketide antibiotics
MTALALPGRARSGLAGTRVLYRLALRRDRIGLAAAVYVITAGVAGTAWTLKRLYPTAAGRAALASAGGGNPALRFLYGRLDGSSVGSLTTNAYLAALMLLAGLVAAGYAMSVVLRLAQLPPVLVLAAVSIAAFGLWPRACVPAAWTALGLVVVIDLFGQALQLSHWILDVSPFTHAPRLPGGAVRAAPLLWLCGIALALSAVGLAALRRRDIG